MERKEILVLLLIFVALGIIAPSCTKTPYACFRVNGSLTTDTVKVNTPVTFNASCSLSTENYNWQFYSNPDSIASGVTVVKIFHDTGTVNVYLFVFNGNKYASSSENIEVVP